MVNKKLFHYFIVSLLMGFFVLGVNSASAMTCGDSDFLQQHNNASSYKCINETSGTSCFTGLCPNDPTNIKCCIPKAGAEGIVPTEHKEKGDYTLDDLVGVFINVANWILGIVGSLALLFFIYGGFMFLISAGSSEKVSKAKEIIIGAVLGIVIVFTSYMIIEFVAAALNIDTGVYKIFQTK